MSPNDNKKTNSKATQKLNGCKNWGKMVKKICFAGSQSARAHSHPDGAAAVAIW